MFESLKFLNKYSNIAGWSICSQIMDEKSLIKKYQKEIQSLKNELEQVKRGVAENPYFVDGHEDLASLKQQVWGYKDVLWLKILFFSVL